MSMKVGTSVEQLVKLIVSISETITAKKEVLNRLDAVLGDGDHGTGLSAGFVVAVREVQALSCPAPADVFKATAMALLNTMGGSSGALYGTFFLKAAHVVADRDVLSGRDWVSLLEAGLEGVIERGKAHVGDKTMVDALQPAVVAFSKAVGAGQALHEAFCAAAQAADQGAQATAEMVARHGRSKFVGERALGHVDAGATSIAFIFLTASTCHDVRC